MRVSSAAASILILWAATVWAQSTSPVTASADNRRAAGSRMVMAGPPQNKLTSVQSATALERMQEMESTLKKMHALLLQMRGKTGSGDSKDPFAKANLEMWQLMLGHLDKQFDQLRMATLEGEDLKARRADMYKQAVAKAALAAQAARKSSASPAMTETTPTPASSTPK